MTAAAERVRLDVLLVERGLADSREKAQALIMAGAVLVADKPAEKAGIRIPRDADVRLRNSAQRVAALRFVSRGGEKLEGALDHFGLDLRDRIAIDVGASTGGFTDCMLQRGARVVYAVDVGTNQLDHTLRSDSRVIVFEQTNARDLESLPLGAPPSFGTVDVSFIGVRKILSPLSRVVSETGDLLILVKPQFELGPEFVERGGVVRDPKHQQLAINLVREAAEDAGWTFVGTVPSRLKGEKKGNQEHFVCLRRAGE